jgi:hypothetical protein
MDIRMEKVRMLVAITERGNGNTITRKMENMGVGCLMRCYGQGTASSEMMDILGLGSSEKDIVIAMGKESAVEDVILEYSDTLRSAGRGGGIMMLLSPTAVGNLTATILSMCTASTPESREVKPMKNEHQHSLILITVNQGYTDQVMQTAKKAGAMGGTILRARLASADKLEQYGDIAAQQEKEVIAILAPVGTAAKIMEEVNKEHGFHTEACGMITALPVDKAYKI